MREPSFYYERKLWKKGLTVIGIDEVGRGAFAGPVVVSAVVCKPFNKPSKNINDSKLIKPKLRQKISIVIKNNAACFSIAQSSVAIINKYGIGKATAIAMRKAIKNIISKYNINSKYFILVDGFHIRYVRKLGLKNQMAIIKGDRKSISIASASIIAKVHRDNLMKALHKKYPLYGFCQNKGYGTTKHREAIKRFGLTGVHRQSFDLKKFL